MMELFDVYDINRNKTGKIIDRHGNEKLKDGEYHLSAKAIIINSKDEILLSQRAENKKKYPLMWEFCGGNCISGENSIQAILRETKEEIGITFNEKEAIFYKTCIREEKKLIKDLWLFKKNIKIEDLKFLDGEVKNVKWVTIDEFEDMCNRNEIIPTIDFSKEDYEKIKNNDFMVFRKKSKC